ncbi:hypothetical protein VCUG_02089 [Vavraia culicis subsp. floridensis]|uniref:Uncharacterized protein n=1 Tax=Vavraia culicis (isolate floridensis) TaxID=948595 RepID=L2GRY7_VAVCU|nr:uncharacterized protein VCUG_02089 [Vavraia culicis subsp. floridensis]ELA46411.1 hypothetical protein VCUG_02089 [Vavraia culicis subsp. floridensis]
MVAGINKQCARTGTSFLLNQVCALLHTSTSKQHTFWPAGTHHPPVTCKIPFYHLRLFWLHILVGAKKLILHRKPCCGLDNTRIGPICGKGARKCKTWISYGQVNAFPILTVYAYQESNPSLPVNSSTKPLLKMW